MQRQGYPGSAGPELKSLLMTDDCIYVRVLQMNILEGFNNQNLEHLLLELQSTLVISNSKGLSEILRDIRTSTYQICRIGEKLIRLTIFNKYTCNWTLEVRDILKILWKRAEIAP